MPPDHHELLLNYHDATIYPPDLRLLDTPNAWLNDACIHFQMTRLSKRRRERVRRRHSNDDDDDDDDDDDGPILFLDPSVVSYMMHQCDDDDLADLCRGWDLRRAGGMLIPVNDHHAANAAAFRTPGGGNHWSMMLIRLLRDDENAAPGGGGGGGDPTPSAAPHRVVKRCLHFDSSGSSNAAAAAAVSARVQRAISLSQGGGGNRVDVDADDETSAVVPVTECRTPQQGNGYDCGIFALGAAEALSAPSLWGDDGDADGGILCAADDTVSMERAVQKFVTDGGGVDFAKNMRSRISNDIRTLAEL